VEFRVRCKGGSMKWTAVVMATHLIC
jgi:hypothetical protein